MQEDIYRRLVRPILTEKSHEMTERHNQVVFEVDPKTNKIELRKAIEKIFSVKVEKINTIRYRGKPKRVGRHFGKRKDWKKVIATLKDGDSINFFLEGV